MNASSVADLAEVLALEFGGHERVTVKIVDDRGIESLKIAPVP